MKFDIKGIKGKSIKENESSLKEFYYYRSAWVRNWQVYTTESSAIYLVYKKSVRRLIDKVEHNLL